MRKSIVITLTAAILGTGTLLGASTSVQAQSSNYYSPANPRGYDYGYKRGAGPATTGSVVRSGVAQSGPVGDESWISYCSAKYRTYDANSNTYWGSDGRQHICRGK
jgi:hypothetical protein